MPIAPDLKSSANSTLTNLANGVITVHPDLVGGAPCFAGTRVPVKNLFDYLEGGDSLDDFLEGFPGVSREQAATVIHLAAEELLKGLQEE